MIAEHRQVHQRRGEGDGRADPADVSDLAVAEAHQVVDQEALPGWLSAHGLPAEMTLEEAAANETLLAEIASAVATANALVSKAEQVKKWSVLTTDFTIEGGELTPTLKVKRNVVMDKYGDEVDAIYA